MKKVIFRTGNIVFLLAIIAMTLICCFNKMSEIVHDESAGFNGSFEVAKSGLPVNWLIYAPTTIPEGNYELIIDTTDFKDGKQSLKFLVHECSPVGGWFSPGLTNEFKVESGKIYKISFWVKNENSKFRIKIGGVSATQGEYDTIVNTEEAIPDWKLFEYDYQMPSEFETIRFELNVLKPGSFWIDDIKIAESNEKSE